MRRAAEALLALLLASGVAAAQDAGPAAAGGGDAKPDSLLQSLKPSGPVTVTADRAEWAKGGAMLYAGHVSMVSDTLTMKGDRLELRQKEQGQYEAILTGGPARLDHAGGTAPTGEVTPPVSAEAKNLYYDTASALVQLTGDAHLTRGTDNITGENIRYDVAARQIRAEGGVVIVITPPPGKGGDLLKTPGDTPAAPRRPNP